VNSAHYDTVLLEYLLQYYLVLIVFRVWKNFTLFSMKVRPLLKVIGVGLMACDMYTALSHWLHPMSFPGPAVKRQSDVKTMT